MYTICDLFTVQSTAQFHCGLAGLSFAKDFDRGAQLKTRFQVLPPKSFRIVTGCFLGLILFVSLLVLLQASSDAGSPAVAAPNDSARSSQENTRQGSPFTKNGLVPMMDRPDAVGDATSNHLQGTQNENVELVGQVSGPASAVVVQSDYAYLSREVDSPWPAGGELAIVNISDPAQPTVVGRTPVRPYSVSGLAVAGNFVYVANGGGDLRIINVANPLAPTEVGFYTTTLRSSSSVAVVGNYAYIADGENGLRVIDVSDPAAPTEVGYYDDTPEIAYDVFVAGDYAYIANGYAGLRVVNVSDPAWPVEVGAYNPLAMWANDVFVAGNHAYVTAGAGLRVIDVTDPAAPEEVGAYEGWGGFGVHVDGNYAYVAAHDNGLRVMDVSDPTTPQ